MISNVNLIEKERYRVAEEKEIIKIKARMDLISILGIFGFSFGMINFQTDDLELSNLLFNNSAEQLLGLKEGNYSLGFAVHTETVSIDLDKLSHEEAVRAILIGLQKNELFSKNPLEVAELEEELYKQLEHINEPPDADASPVHLQALEAIKKELNATIRLAEEAFKRVQISPVLHSSLDTPDDGSYVHGSMVRSLNIEGIGLPQSPESPPAQPFDMINCDWSGFLSKLGLEINDWGHAEKTERFNYVLDAISELASLNLNNDSRPGILLEKGTYNYPENSMSRLSDQKKSLLLSKVTRSYLHDKNIEGWTKEQQTIYIINLIVQELQLGGSLDSDYLKLFFNSIGNEAHYEFTRTNSFQTRLKKRLKTPANESGAYLGQADLQEIANSIVEKNNLDSTFFKEQILKLLESIDGESELKSLFRLYVYTNQQLLNAGVITEFELKFGQKEMFDAMSVMDEHLPELEIFIGDFKENLDAASDYPTVEVSKGSGFIKMGGQRVARKSIYKWEESIEVTADSSIFFPDSISITLPVKKSMEVINAPKIDRAVKIRVPELFEKVKNWFSGTETVISSSQWEVVIREALVDSFPEATFTESYQPYY